MMGLHSPLFLFLFLPVFLLAYMLSPGRWRNGILLIFSLAFFAWNEPFYFPAILLLALGNELLLRRLGCMQLQEKARRRAMAAGVAVNVTFLLIFKAVAAYAQPLAEQLVSAGFVLPGWLVFLLPYMAHLPLGISFFAFQTIGMLLDAEAFSGGMPGTGTILNYLLMFPKAIAGPIARFGGTLPQLLHREHSLDKTTRGIRRFVLGFAKKALIADQIALITDRGIFTLPPAHLPFRVAWLVVIAYTLQIYVDFSAYTDMAIGLGGMIGLDLPENFNFPYIARGISDFWRRWHISLSSWFRDYVFYPLEKARAARPRLSRTANILIVFFLTGLWHGLSLNFIAWGMLHGLAILLENGRFGAWFKKCWRPLQHAYTLAVLITGWVIFRSPSLVHAAGLVKALVGLAHPARPLAYSLFPPVSTLTWCALAAGALLCFPLPKFLSKIAENIRVHLPALSGWAEAAALLALFAASVMAQAGSTYLPFLYGEF